MVLHIMAVLVLSYQATSNNETFDDPIVAGSVAYAKWYADMLFVRADDFTPGDANFDGVGEVDGSDVIALMRALANVG